MRATIGGQNIEGCKN